MSRRNLKTMPREAFAARIDSMAHDGRGVAHVNGKATFIAGALPGEEVTFIYQTQRKHFDEGRLAEIIQASPHRVTPGCEHFGVCGGCSLQHLDAHAQIGMKQDIMLENLRRIGDVVPEQVMAPLTGPHWAYRRKARLGAKFVLKKQAMLVGFREKQSGLLAELTRCAVLQAEVGENLMALRALLRGLDAYDRIPQIELAAGDQAIALVFRHLAALSDNDLAALTAFGRQHGFQIYLQPGGPESAHLLWPEAATLSYSLPDHRVELMFQPTDFVQVNAAVNRAMVNRALELLDVQGSDQVLDLFCGLGNFTLPLARHAASVVGVEGDAGLIARARLNALHNGINNVEYHVADLDQAQAAWPWLQQKYDKILLDPPRTGAIEIVRRLERKHCARLVYVSCNPATLARDAAELVHRKGYHLRSAGVMDMFPHTTHVECIALFEK